MRSSRVGIMLALACCAGCGNSPSSPLAQLDNDDPAVRLKAAVTIGQARDTSAVDKLVEVMERDADNDVRHAAARALGHIGDGRAAPALLRIVTGSAQLLLRGVAVNALGRLRDPHSISGMVAVWELEPARNNNGAIQAGVFYTLSEIGDVSYEPLVAALGSGHPRVRRYAAETLGRIGDKRAASAIVPLLQDVDALVRREARYALERLAEP